MKRFILLLAVGFTVHLLSAQEFADFELTGTHRGTGTFTHAVLSGFTWQVEGTLAREVQILNDEVFDDGNQFEAVFGQADRAENLRTQVLPNGSGTSGQPITSKARMTIEFNEVTPAEGWGFCIVDIDVENCLISAVDENDNPVSADDIDKWLVELFDANLSEDGLNIPKWDAAHAALLGSDTPDDYTVYDSLVIGGMPSSEAPSAFFMPDIPLKSLIIDFENLQQNYNTSFHLYIASQEASGINENQKLQAEIFPNPAVNEFGVRSPEFGVGNAIIELYGLDGRKLLEKQIPKGTDEINIDVSSLQNGLFLCRISAVGYSATKKLIIKR